MIMTFPSQARFRKPLSTLEEFGQHLTPRAIPAAMRFEGTKEDRIAWGVGTAALVTAHAFASGLQKHVDKMPSMGWKQTFRLPYDDLMVEAAAFCHYILSKDYPVSDDDDGDEYDEGGEGDLASPASGSAVLRRDAVASPCSRRRCFAGPPEQHRWRHPRTALVSHQQAGTVR